MTVKGDPFGRDVTLTDKQKQDMNDTKISFEEAWTALELLAPQYRGRDLALAKTHLQDSCMWAVRAITKMPGHE